MSGKPAKKASVGVIARIASLKDGISKLFKVIRTARIVLRHIEACLVELWGVAEAEIDAQPTPQPTLTDAVAEPSRPHPEPLEAH